MKKVIRTLFVLTIILNVGLTVSQGIAQENQVPSHSYELNMQQRPMTGGLSPLSIVACTGGYGICMDKSESWWERMFCSGAWIGCLALA